MESTTMTPAQLRKQQQKRRSRLRAGIQTVFFLYMPGAFAAGFAGAKNLAQQVGKAQALQANSFVLTLLAVCVCTMLFGRYFCGYVCSFGSTGDFVYWVSGLVQKKLLKRKKQFRLPEKVALPAQKVKYVVLILILSLCVLGKYGSLSGTSPWDVFARLTALRAPADGYAIGIALLVLIVVGMAVHPRFFCQFLCPLGAIFSLLPAMPLMQLHRNAENCIRGCQACKMNCPVSLKLDENDGREGECISCEKCVDTCPRSNIARPATDKWPLVATILKAVIFALLGLLLGLSRIG